MPAPHCARCHPSNRNSHLRSGRQHTCVRRSCPESRSRRDSLAGIDPEPPVHAPSLASLIHNPRNAVQLPEVGNNAYNIDLQTNKDSIDILEISSSNGELWIILDAYGRLYEYVFNFARVHDLHTARRLYEIYIILFDVNIFWHQSGDLFYFLVMRYCT